MYIDPTKQPRDPNNPNLTIDEQKVFGVDAKLHPITRLPLEQGSGSMPPDAQAVAVHLPAMQANLAELADRLAREGNPQNKAHYAALHEAADLHLSTVKVRLKDEGYIDRYLKWLATDHPTTRKQPF